MTHSFKLGTWLCVSLLVCGISLGCGKNKKEQEQKPEKKNAAPLKPQTPYLDKPQHMQGIVNNQKTVFKEPVYIKIVPQNNKEIEVRKNPDQNAPVLFTLPRGCLIRLDSTLVRPWVKVNLPYDTRNLQTSDDLQLEGYISYMDIARMLYVNGSVFFVDYSSAQKIGMINRKILPENFLQKLKKHPQNKRSHLMDDRQKPGYSGLGKKFPYTRNTNVSYEHQRHG